MGSTRFANITSVLALCVSMFSAWFSWNQATEANSFKVSVAETTTNNKIIFTYDSLHPTLTVPLRFYVLNGSGVKHLLTDIGYEVVDESDDVRAIMMLGSDNIYEVNKGPLLLPKNIEPKEPITIELSVTIPLSKYVAEIILRESQDPTFLSKPYSFIRARFRYESRMLKVSEKTSLYNLIEKKSVIYFKFMSTSDGNFEELTFETIIP